MRHGRYAHRCWWFGFGGKGCVVVTVGFEKDAPRPLAERPNDLIDFMHAVRTGLLGWQRGEVAGTVQPWRTS
jgi:hypothetical protein